MLLKAAVPCLGKEGSCVPLLPKRGKTGGT